jgi:hypothetical protein
VDNFLAYQIHLVLSGKAIQRRVQRANGQPDPAPRQFRDELDDGAAIQCPILQGHEHQECRVPHLGCLPTHATILGNNRRIPLGTLTEHLHVSAQALRDAA